MEKDPIEDYLWPYHRRTSPEDKDTLRRLIATGCATVDPQLAKAYSIAAQLVATTIAVRIDQKDKLPTDARQEHGRNLLSGHGRDYNPELVRVVLREWELEETVDAALGQPASPQAHTRAA